MGCTGREKHIRANRRARSVKSESDHHHHQMHSTSSNKNNNNLTTGKSVMASDLRPMNYPIGLSDSTQNPNPYQNNSSVFDDSGWGYCTEEQLEEILLKNLEFLYNEAISKLVAMGYDEEVALKAILRNGHCYGGMDVLTNILHNSLAYLNSGNNSDESEQVFANLRHLEEYSLAGMVCLLQQIKSNLSRGDAMWCLLMSDLHVGRASMMEIPFLSSPRGNTCGSSSDGGTVSASVEGVCNGPVGVAPALYRFHGGWGFGNGGNSEFPVNEFFSCASEMTLQREIQIPKRFNLSPSMKHLLRRNVAAFAAGFRANSKQVQNQSHAFSSSLSGQDSSGSSGMGTEDNTTQTEEHQNQKNQDAINSVLSKFRDLNLDENAENGSLDQKDEMILSLVHEIKDLERQVKERKEWAHQKAMQAARKLSNDLTELKMLRMEKEERQRLKKGKTIEDGTMKSLADMENALRKASAQVDRANAAVRKLETENAEIRAEIEAAKLSESESGKTCLEVAKREKKYLKKVVAREKQRTKLQEDIAAEKQKISEFQQQLVQIEVAQKETEAKWKQEQKAKELALAQVEEEQRLLEASEAGNKRKLEALRLKIEIDFQRYKDDLQRLEQEAARLRASKQSTEVQNQSNSTGKSGDTNPQGDTIARLLHEFDMLEDLPEKEASCERKCLFCKKAEVSVVFLPCAHQVLCSSCNDNYGKKGKAACPCCRVPIAERIRVFGTSS